MKSSNQHSAPLAEEIDLRKIVQRVLRAWPVFALAFAFWIGLAIVFQITYPAVYEAKTSIEIQEPQRIDDPNRMILGSQRFNEPDKYYFVNHQVKLSSYPIVEKAIEKLDFRVKYIQKGLFNKDLYKASPISVVFDSEMSFNESSTPFNLPFYIDIVDQTKFNLEADGEYESTGKPVALTGSYSFGQWIEFDNVRFQVNLNEMTSPGDLTAETYGFEIVNLRELAFDYMEEIAVRRAELDASIFTVKMQGSPAQKTEDFIRALGETYVELHLVEKNAVIDRTIAHIDNELNKVMGILKDNELAVEQYKTGSGIVSLGQSGRLLLEQTANLEKERTNLEIKQQYFTHLRNFLKDQSNMEKVMSPQAFGISDPFLTTQINNLVRLQMERATLESEGKQSHPAYSQIERNIESYKTNILESVAGFETSNDIRRKGIEAQIASLENESEKIPLNELELLRLERVFSLNESLYKTLMAKKMEAEISRAATEPDIVIAEPAYITSIDPVFPSLPVLITLAVLLGILTPLGGMVIRGLFNRTVTTTEELNRLAPEVPVISLAWSNIQQPEELLTFHQSQTAEEIRRIAVQLKQKKGQIIAIHSGESGEGKSYVASLLSTSMASDNANILLIDGDGREQNVKDQMDGQSIPNLTVIQIDDTSIDLDQLRESYDHIIIDAPPCRLSANATKLMAEADHNVLVVRRKRSRYEHLSWVLEQPLLMESEWAICVFNDHQSESPWFLARNRYYRNKPRTVLQRFRTLLMRA